MSNAAIVGPTSPAAASNEPEKNVRGGELLEDRRPCSA